MFIRSFPYKYTVRFYDFLDRCTSSECLQTVKPSLSGFSFYNAQRSESHSKHYGCAKSHLKCVNFLFNTHELTWCKTCAVTIAYVGGVLHVRETS